MAAILHYRVVDALPEQIAPNAIYYVKKWRGYDTVITDAAGLPLRSNDRYTSINFGGQFLCDPNEINGWGSQGFTDDTNVQNLGLANATSLSRHAGGLHFSFDVKVLRFSVWHRNNTADVEPWGWIVAKQTKVDDSDAQTGTIFVHEVNDNGGVGPRDYGDDLNHRTDLDLTSNADSIIPAGDVLTVGVACPTAVEANRYIQVMSGLLELERL